MAIELAPKPQDNTISPFWLFLLIPALLLGFELGGYFLRHATSPPQSKDMPDTQIASPVALPRRAPTVKPKIKERLLKTVKTTPSKTKRNRRVQIPKPTPQTVAKRDRNYSSSIGSPTGLASPK